MKKQAVTVRYYANPLHEKFVQDMNEAGYETKYYRGRFFYQGPAVKCEQDELQDIIRATRIVLQWDDLGRTGLVIYPKGERRINERSHHRTRSKDQGTGREA